MKATVIGVQTLDFENDGKKIVGTKLYLTHGDMNVHGLCSSTKFIQPSNELGKKFAPYLSDLDSIIGHQIFLDTDLKGRIQDFDVLPIETVTTETTANKVK